MPLSHHDVALWSTTADFSSTIVEHATDLIAAFDLDYRYRVCNRAYREAFRSMFHTEVCVGMTIAEAFARVPLKQQKVIARCREALSGGQSVLATRFGDRAYEITHQPMRDQSDRIFGAMQIAHDISAQVGAEQTLRESEARFRRVVENVREAIMVDDVDGRVVFANDRFLQMFGLDREELGRIAIEDYTAPEYRQQARARHEARVRGEAEPTTYEYEGMRKDGTRLWLEVDVVPITDAKGRVTHTQSAIRDVTERRAAEERLRRNDNMLRAIMQYVPEGITISDAEGNIVQSSRAGLDLCHLTAEPPTIGDFLEGSRLLHPDGGAPADPDHLAFVRAIKNGEVVTGEELILERPDGTRVPLLANAAPILDDEGRTTGAILVYRDISERKAVEDALRLADERKSQFLPVIAHELRNPLSSIRYGLAVIQRHDLAGAASRAADAIERQMRQLTRLVDDLLDVGRISRGKLALQCEYVDVRDAVRTAVEAVSPNIVRARHSLDLSVPAEPIWLHADAARLRQVVTNLLHNASKFTPRGGHIAVSIECEENMAVVKVRDDGIGFEPKNASSLFGMFTQGQAHERHGGLGIGLSLVKQLVELHGGTIEARSDGVGTGAEFVVRLPVASEPKGELAATPKDDARAGATTRRLRVLLADDNADLVEMLALAVETLGHEVRKALDGRTAVNAALAFRPDVVLLDLNLPCLSGKEVVCELRTHAETKDTYVVALTGCEPSDDDVDKFDTFLVKPPEPGELESLLTDRAVRRAER